MYRIIASTKFKKDLKIILKRGYNPSLLDEIVTKLALGKQLDERYSDHPLKGNYSGCRECYVTPDWLLIYKIQDNNLVLYLTRTGTHSDLF